MVRVVHSIRSRKFGHNIFLKKSTPDSSDPNIDEAANNLAEASLQIQNVFTIVTNCSKPSSHGLQYSLNRVLNFVSGYRRWLGSMIH